jgi:O-antigen/teichoic acid export membrane protein
MSGQPPEPSLARRLAGGTSWVALAQMLPLVFNLALTPFIIHGLGVELYGIFLLVTVIQQFIGSVDGGVGPSTRRFFGIYAGQSDRAAATSLLVTLLALIGAAATVICGLFFLAAPQIMAFFPGTSADPEGSTFLLRVMIVIVAVAQLRGPFTQILMTANLFRITAVGDLIGFFAYAAGMVLTVQHGLGLVGVAWSFVAQQVMPTIVVVPAALRRLDRHALRFVERGVLKDFFRYAWKLQVSGTLTVLAAQGDALFVGRFAAPQMTAFGTGASFATTLRNIPMNASLPMDASIVRAIGRHGPAGAAAEAARIQRHWIRLVAGWIAVGVPAGGFGVTAWLHLGTSLPGQVAAVVLLAHGVALVMLVQRYWLNALGRSGLTLSYDVISTVVNLSLTFPLILRFGVLGTIAATLAAAVVAAVYLTWVGQRRIDAPIPTPWSQVPWLDVLLAGVLAAASCWAVATFVTGHLVPFGALSLLVIGAAAAPALALYLIRVVGLRRLRGMVARVVSRRRP